MNKLHFTLITALILLTGMAREQEVKVEDVKVK